MPIAAKIVCFSRLLKCLRSLNSKQCGPKSDCSYRSSPGSMLSASILNSSVMSGNYLQQTTSADNIFRCIFFLGALRVKWHMINRTNHLCSIVVNLLNFGKKNGRHAHIWSKVKRPLTLGQGMLNGKFKSYKFCSNDDLTGRFSLTFSCYISTFNFQNFEVLIKTVEETGGIMREIREHEDQVCFNSLPTSVVCWQLFANNLDPYQARQNVGPDLDPNCLTHWWCSWKNFSKMLILKKISRRQLKTCEIIQ